MPHGQKNIMLQKQKQCRNSRFTPKIAPSNETVHAAFFFFDILQKPWTCFKWHISENGRHLASQNTFLSCFLSVEKKIMHHANFIYVLEIFLKKNCKKIAKNLWKIAKKKCEKLQKIAKVNPPLVDTWFIRMEHLWQSCKLSSHNLALVYLKNHNFMGKKKTKSFKDC